MFSVKLVEVAVIRGVMFRPVPPVPVTALGDQNFFVCQLALFLGCAGRCLLIKIARVVEIIPSFVIFRRSDPNIKVGVNPRSRNQRFEMGWVFVTRHGLRNRHRFNARIIMQCVIKSAQKFAARMRIVFPGIFAVQNNRNHRVLAFCNNRLRRFSNLMDEVSSCLLRGHSRVDKTD